MIDKIWFDGNYSYLCMDEFGTVLLGTKDHSPRKIIRDYYSDDKYNMIVKVSLATFNVDITV